jgi:hypothetical protein
MTATKALALIAAAATVAALLPSCTRVVTDARAVAGEEPIADVSDENLCTPVDAPLAVIPSDPGEPVLKIPQPPGWERFTEMDSEIVRYAMRNDSLGAVAVVTAESMAGVGDPEDAFEGVREGISELLGPTATLDVTRLEHCGLPAETMPFVNPGIGQSGAMPTESLSVVMVDDGSTHIVSVQAATKMPDDPVAARDVDTIITGFQILPPSAG